MSKSELSKLIAHYGNMSITSSRLLSEEYFGYRYEDIANEREEEEEDYYDECE